MRITNFTVGKKNKKNKQTTDIWLLSLLGKGIISTLSEVKWPCSSHGSSLAATSIGSEGNMILGWTHSFFFFSPQETEVQDIKTVTSITSSLTSMQLSAIPCLPARSWHIRKSEKKANSVYCQRERCQLQIVLNAFKNRHVNSYSWCKNGMLRGKITPGWQID